VIGGSQSAKPYIYKRHAALFRVGLMQLKGSLLEGLSWLVKNCGKSWVGEMIDNAADTLSRG